jgi:hypothetical protein
MEEEYSTAKKKAANAPQTPLVEKVKEATFTPATEASTPGENSSTAPTGEVASFSSSDDLSSISSEGKNNTSPVRPQALVFEEKSMKKILEEQEKKPETKKEETTTAMSILPLKLILLAIVFAFLSKSGNMFPKKIISVAPVVESATIETATIETAIEIEEPAIDVDADIDVENNVEIDVDVEEGEAEAVE